MNIKKETYHQRYYRLNKEKHDLYSKEYREENIEKSRIWHQKHYQENTEKCKRQATGWSRANPEKAKLHGRRWIVLEKWRKFARRIVEKNKEPLLFRKTNISKHGLVILGFLDFSHPATPNTQDCLRTRCCISHFLIRPRITTF